MILMSISLTGCGTKRSSGGSVGQKCSAVKIEKKWDGPVICIPAAGGCQKSIGLFAKNGEGCVFIQEMQGHAMNLKVEADGKDIYCQMDGSFWNNIPKNDGIMNFDIWVVDAYNRNPYYGDVDPNNPDKKVKHQTIDTDLNRITFQDEPKLPYRSCNGNGKTTSRAITSTMRFRSALYQVGMGHRISKLDGSLIETSPPVTTPEKYYEWSFQFQTRLNGELWNWK